MEPAITETALAVETEPLLHEIRSLIEDARSRVAQAVNQELTALYWRIGERVHREVLGHERADYGQQVVERLAVRLTALYGKGYSRSALFRMMQFVERFPDYSIVASLSRQLSWSHWAQIITIEDALKRDFYTQMCRVERWSVRTLQSKIKGMLFERTALSQKPEELARQELAALRDSDRLTPDLVFQDPYVLDFLGFADTYSEQDLEAAILRELERFLLEMGAGFAFVARQKRISTHSLYGRRAVYYLSKTYADQIGSGEDYSHLNTVIGIHFLDFKCFADDRVLRRFVFKDVETNDAPAQLNCVQLYFIEMPKFGKDWSEIKTAFDRWVAFFNRGEDVDTDAMPEQLAQDPAVARALVELERAGLSPAERDIYEGEVKKKMVDAVQLMDARRESLQEGIEIGEQKGLRRLLLRQMARRLGEVPSSITASLESLSADALEDLGVSLPDLHTYPDVEQWLAQH